MIYKAKESYFKLKDSENFCAHWSANKHRLLIAGESIDVTVVPKALEKHLLENIQVYDPKNENTPFEMWYVYEDKTTGKTERRHIGTDTHRTGGDASKVAGQHGSDLQEGIEDVQPKEENI